MATISPTPVNGTEEGTEGVEMVAPAPIDPRAPTENAGISPNPTVDEPNPDLPPSQDPLPEQVVGSPDVENPAAADVSKPATMERRGTVHDLNHNWTLSEGEHLSQTRRVLVERCIDSTASPPFLTPHSTHPIKKIQSKSRSFAGAASTPPGT